MSQGDVKLTNQEIHDLYRRYCELVGKVAKGNVGAAADWALLPWDDPKFVHLLAPVLQKQNRAAVQHAHVTEWAKTVGLTVIVQQSEAQP